MSGRNAAHARWARGARDRHARSRWPPDRALLHPAIVAKLAQDPDFIRLRRLQRRYAFTIAGSVVAFYVSLGVTMAYWPEVLDIRLVPGRWITVGLIWNVLGLLGWFAATATYAALSTRRLTPLRARVRERHGWNSSDGA
ncbi:MAG: DUF485 domain-containing protein [Gammaproteobacteria bacterium]|nr:DUF485 domain-containing protein [Gammaproteobacteria bacterium]MYD00741.1 DUF485 domain-containing protein [Gammaproteobacteria bacterium]MYI25471.1 DUF485 domain-containing protein [Gammaproteobacteria bacterium]